MSLMDTVKMRKIFIGVGDMTDIDKTYKNINSVRNKSLIGVGRIGNKNKGYQ